MKKALIALAAAAALALTLALAACDTPDETHVVSTPGGEVTVREMYRNINSYEDPYAGQVLYSYILPKVEGPDTDYIFDINMFVAKANRDMVESSLAAMQEKEGIGYITVKYDAQLAGNMISMIMQWTTLYDNWTEAKVWLIRADGTEGTNAELFAACGVTEAQVLAKVREVLGTVVNEPDYAGIEQTNGTDMANLARSAYTKTFSNSNINGQMPYYINEDGHLAVVAKVYMVAGPEYKYQFLDLGFVPLDPADVPTPTPTPTPVVDPTPAVPVTVRDLYRNTGIYRDPFQGEVPYAYILPWVDGPDTDYIFDINMFVQKKNRELVGPAVDAMEDGEAIGYASVEYEAHKAGDLTSIIMRWTSLYDNWTEAQVWLIRADGTHGTNAELFAACGTNETEVVAKVREALSAVVSKPDYDRIAAAAGKDMADMAMEVYNKTFSDENINSHLPFYINDEGHLAVVVKAYSMAGAEYYYKFLDLGFRPEGSTDVATPTQPTQEPTTTPSQPTQTPSTPAASTSQVKITDLFSKTGTYRDRYLGQITYSYRLPKVDGPDTDFLFDINTFVAKINKNCVEESLIIMEQGGALQYANVDYVAGTAGNITTLILMWSNAGDNQLLYETWVIHPDGTKAEKGELFDAKGVTSDEVLAKVRTKVTALLGDFDYDKIASALGKEFADEEKACRDQTLDEISTHMNFFINEAGHLAVVAPVYHAGGTKIYTIDLDI